MTAKDAFGVKVGKNAAMDPSAAGDIYSLSVGELDIERDVYKRQIMDAYENAPVPLRFPHALLLRSG